MLQTTPNKIAFQADSIKSVPGLKKIRTPHATSSLQNFDMTAQWTAIKKSQIPRVLPINHFRYIQSSTRPVSNVQPRSGAIFAESKKMAGFIFFRWGTWLGSAWPNRFRGFFFRWSRARVCKVSLARSWVVRKRFFFRVLGETWINRCSMRNIVLQQLFGFGRHVDK